MGIYAGSQEKEDGGMIKMAEEKKEASTTTGFYVGKELVKEGNINGKDWKVYKIKFKPRMDAEKGFSFSCFAGLKAKGSKQLEDLKEGTEYKIVYSEADAVSKAGQPFTSKTAFAIYSAPTTEDKKPTPRAPEQEDSPEHDYQNGFEAGKASVTALKPNLDKFEAFRVKYLAKLKDAGITPNATHMVGSFIATTEKERVAELVEKCKEALK